MIIRKLEAQDEEKLENLIREVEKGLVDETFWLPINETSRTHFFDDEWTYFLGAFEEDRLVGAVGLFLNKNEYEESQKILEIDDRNLAEYGRAMVSPEFQNQGIMKELLIQLLEYAKKMGVERVIATVHPNNISSQSVVKKMGFQKMAFVTKLNKYDRDIFLKEL